MTFKELLACVILAFLFADQPGFSQSAYADSVYGIWQDASYPDSVRCTAFSRYAFQLMYNYPDSMETLIKEELEKVKGTDLKRCECNLINDLGLIEHHRGNLDESRAFFEESYAIAKKNGFKREELMYYNNIGTLYNSTLDYESAIKNFRQALKLADELEDVEIHNTLHNIALGYANIGDPEKALEYYKLSLDERKALKDTLSMLYSYINIGVLYMNQEVTDSAQNYFELCREAATRINDQRVLGYAEINLSEIYHKQQDFEAGIKATQAAQRAFNTSGNIAMEQMGFLAEARHLISKGDYRRAIEVAKKYQDTSEVSDNIFYLSRYYDRMYDAYKGLGKFDSALVYLELKQVHELRKNKTGAAKELENFEAEKRALQDSIKAAEERALLQAQHESTLDAKNRQRNGLILAGVIVLAAAIYLFRRWKRTRLEKEASEEILDNILPSEISAEIKAKGKADSKVIDNVTILFTDFKGFTSMAETMNPQDLVEDLNICFSEFDNIVEAYGIEKIKTIGDAYMAAGGLKAHDNDHVQNVIKAALKMRDFIEEGKARKIEAGLPYFEIRLGIHTGGVVAGIVGVKKLQYDIWGDTVNTASRMESSSEAGKVNISQTTYELVKDNPAFSFESRGEIEAKGKGMMAMYFVEPSA